MDKFYISLLALLLATQAQAIQISSRNDSMADWHKRATLADALTADSWLVSSYSNNRLVFDMSGNTTTPLSHMLNRSSMLTRADVNTFGFTGRSYTPGSFDKIFSDWGLQLLHPDDFNVAQLTGATDIHELELTGNTGDYVDQLLEPMGFRTGQGYYIVRGDISKLASVPEPSILALLGAGLLGIGLVRRKKRS